MSLHEWGGSLAYMSAFMLLAYSGTVVLMPFMVPWLAEEFTADLWTIARPLLLFIALPLVIGAAIRRALPGAEQQRMRGAARCPEDLFNPK